MRGGARKQVVQQIERQQQHDGCGARRDAVTGMPPSLPSQLINGVKDKPSASATRVNHTKVFHAALLPVISFQLQHARPQHQAYDNSAAISV